MAQNIYDDPAFFAAYAGLPRSVVGLDGAAEWPMLRSLLPDLVGRRMVDLGCGFGWYCRWAAEAGAASVLGIDLSTNMLERARGTTDDERITYEQQDLDALDLPAATFDVAFSSLTLHYLVHLDAVLTAVHRALVPGGAFVCSVEHPIFTAPTSPAFASAADGHPIWPLDAYSLEGPRTTDWLAPGVVKHHRTIGTYVSLLVAAGYTIASLIEWSPSDEQLVDHPEWTVERDRPPFLLLAARRH